MRTINQESLVGCGGFLGFEAAVIVEVEVAEWNLLESGGQLLVLLSGVQH